MSAIGRGGAVDTFAVCAIWAKHSARAERIEGSVMLGPRRRKSRLEGNHISTRTYFLQENVPDLFKIRQNYLVYSRHMPSVLMSWGYAPPAGIGPADETKDRREDEADKSSDWRVRFSEHHRAD